MPIPKDRLQDHLKVGLRLFRYTAHRSSTQFKARIYEEVWKVVKLTPKGCYIEQVRCGDPNDLILVTVREPKWIGWTTKFVRLSKEQALRDLYLRCRSHMEILTKQQDTVEAKAKVIKQKMADEYGEDVADKLPKIERGHVRRYHFVEDYY